MQRKKLANKPNRMRAEAKNTKLTERIAVKIGKIDDVLGWLLVAATAKGLRYIALGDDEAAVQNMMEKYFADIKYDYIIDDAVVAGDDLHHYFAVMQALCRGEVLSALPPLDIYGSDLQKQIWQVLMTIPRGEVLTYQQVGAKIGKHQRVIGTHGMGKNPLGVIIPCHRVVYKDRKAQQSYGFGATRKIELLRREGYGGIL